MKCKKSGISLSVNKNDGYIQHFILRVSCVFLLCNLKLMSSYLVLNVVELTFLHWIIFGNHLLLSCLEASPSHCHLMFAFSCFFMSVIFVRLCFSSFRILSLKLTPRILHTMARCDFLNLSARAMIPILLVTWPVQSSLLSSRLLTISTK